MSITLLVSTASQQGAVPSLAFSKLRKAVLALVAFLFLAASAFANTYTVTNTLDDNNPGSLRYAVNQANANAGADDIVFNISGTGPFSIAIGSTLTLTGPTVIDGTTQPGFSSGAQSTYVKVGTAFAGTIFAASNVTGITIKGLDLSYSSPRQGAGIGFSNCNQTFILDNFIRNRNTGISINGGQDHTIQNNDLVASGQDTNQPCIYLANITPGSIPSGVAMSSNKFGGNANMGFRFDNMNNLVIRDALVSGANIVIEDNSGFTAMGTAGQFMMWFNNCNNITVDNVDLSWLGGGISSSHGIIISNAVTNSTFTVKNCSIKNRYSGIQINNGKDVTIQNNDLRGTGHEDSYAVNLSNITEANVNGGILMSGNLWGRNTGVAESNGGLRLSNTNNLIIGDENTGVNIKIEDNNGFNTIAGNNANRNPMYLENVSNITVDNVDASWSLGGVVNSMGIRIQNTGSNGNITIKNCKVQNRYYGMYCNDGKDYTITGNDLRGSGHENAYALYLLNIAQGMIPGGVSVSGNLWGRNGAIESNGGLYIADMSNLIIGDATTGVHIKIEDNSGFNTLAGNEGTYRGGLLLERVSNITVDNVDASWSLGGITNSFGIFVQNETTQYSGQTTSHRNVTIKDCDFRNRGMGIRIRGGKDYTVTGNDLRGCGEHGHHALQLINIQAGTLTGGILAHTNKFGTGAATINNGIYIQQMNDLSIGDATTGGNIKIEDNSGLNQIVGNDVNNRGALYLNTVSNVTVNSVDCSYSPGGQAGSSFGIRVANTASNSNISILNCLAGNRGRGIWVDNGRDYTITGNNMVGSGNGTPALELSNIIPGSLTGGILASGNTFGTPNFHRGVAISNMRDLLIGDASVLNANFVLEDNSGLNQCVGGDYNSHGVLYLSNVNNVTVDNVDCSKSTAGASSSYSILVSNGANNQGVTIKNCKADNRYRGIYCGGGKDYTVQNNTITNSGWDGTACALDFRDITAGALPGGVLVSGNTFGNVPITANVSRAGVRFDNMRDLYIGDATTGGNVKLEDGSGLTAVGFDANSNYNTITLNNVSNSTLDNLDVSSAFTGPAQRNFGIRINNSVSQGYVAIKDCNIQNRRTGIYIASGSDYTITGNDLTNTGANSSEPAVWLNGLVKNTLDGGIAMSGNTFGGATANTALRLTDMREFTIGDAGVSGADIVLEDGILATVGNGLDNVVYLEKISNVTVDNVDFTRSGGTQYGLALRVENGNGNGALGIVNCDFGTRRTGVYIVGGKDYTIQNNDFTTSGPNNADASLWLNGVLAGALPGGVSISGNTFGGANANCAVRFENLKDIVIGDASVVGRNVTLEDGTSGLSAVGNNATSNESVLYFSNLTNSSINNVDLTRTGGTQYGQGIYVANGLAAYPFSITNCAVGNRRTGIYINGGRNYTVQNNTLTGSGNNFNEPALYLNSLTVNSSLLINNNTFGGANFNTGIRVENTSDLLISDGTVSGTHIGVTTANGLGNATGYALYLANLTRTKVQNMDLSFTTTTRTGTGIQVTTNSGATAQVEMKSLIVKNRVDGINIASGANHSVKCSDLSDNSDGLEVASGVTSFACEQNSFVGNIGFAINSAATITAENNYFGGGAPGGGANGVTGSVDATPFLTSAPANCPTTLAAYLELKGNQNLILNGSTTPTTVNYTDLGSVKTSTPITRTFTINNPGGVALNITSISFTGGNAGDFSASALTPASPVPAGGSATFTITFTPGAASLRSTTLSIANDDPNNNPFTAALQGTGKNALVVTKTADTNDGVCDADCSLREAITVANSNADADVIEFNIGGGGAQTITHTTAFPNITQPLTIDGSSQPGFAGTPLITVNSNSNLTTFTATNVTGLTIKYMDLSRPIANYDGNGIIVNNCNEVFILNNVLKNRFLGIQSNSGRDHTIQNNDLRQTGADANNPAIYLSSLTARDVPGGIKMSGNLFGDATGNNRSRFGVRINNMSNLLIGDASVANAHITIEDGSGMASTGTGDNYCLLLNNVSNTTVDNLDLTATTYGFQGWGVVVSNTTDYGNVTIKTCKINNRYTGVYCASGRDYTIQNNDLQKTGLDVNHPSLWFQNVTPGTLPTGILASGNTFGDASGNNLSRFGIRISNMSNLLIGDASVANAHITIEDGSGMASTGTGENYCLYLDNVSNTTVDNLDLTATTYGYQGWGLVVQNSASNRNVTIKNCKMNNRFSGIYCIGGKDYTILNNDLKNAGLDNNHPALFLYGIRPGALPAGVVASGNFFGTGTSRTALRVSDMDGLVIGDAGAHIVVEDASGANSMSTDGDNAVIYLNAVSNLTVNDVDVSRSASGRGGVGIWVENSGNTVYRNLSILNCKMQQRDMGLYINGGKDVTVTNNDMRYSGYYQDRPALWLGNIQSISLPGGVSLSGNKFGGSSNGATSNSGIQFVNMRDLVMADAAAPGVNIVLEDNSGLNDVYGDEVSIRGVLYLNNVRNAQMTSIDLSKMTAGQGTSYALKVNNGVNVSVLNGKGSNRYHGYYFEGGRDLTVTGNDLTGSGNQRDYPALRFSNVQPGSVNTANGIAASGNLFGGANVRTGLRIDNAKNLLIRNTSVGGAHIVIEDNSGLNNITQGDGNSEHPAIYLSTVSDITVDNVDASRPSGQDAGGIWVSNSITNTNITIKNCNFNRHRRAIYCTGGRDYTIQNNTLLNSGGANDQPAIYLQNIQQGSLTGGILMSGNTFGGASSFGGIRFENMRDLTIGDLNTGGNVKIEDNSGLNNMGGNSGGNSSNYVLHFNNVNNATVDNVDLSRPVGATPAQDFTGIRIDNGAAYGPITIKDCNLSRHRSGISAQGGKDYTVTGNDLRGCGANSDEPALWFNGITQQDGTVPMGILAHTNTFGTVNSVVSNCALRLDNLCGIRISDGTVANSHIKIAAASGIKEVTGTGGNNPAVILMVNTSGMAVEKMDLEFTGTQTGTGIRFQNANASQYSFSIKDNILKNRRMGVYIANGADYTLTGNNFQMTGAADDEPAIRMEHVAEGTLYGGVSMSGNSFGGTGAAFGLKFVNMSNLKISDGSLSGTNVNLGSPSANGLYNVTTGNVLHLSGICNATVGMLDLSRAGLTRQGVGLRMNAGMGNTIQKVLVGNRDKGIEIAGGSNSQSFTCNTLFDNNLGIDVVLGTLLSTTLTNNILDCNGTGLRSTSTSTVAASNNYWGTANGSTTSGGSGDTYTGTVTATPFLAAAPVCAQTPPDLETKGNSVEIVDGDITPSFDDYTQYCAVTGQVQSHTYTLKNTGNGIMNLVGATPVTLSPASGTPFTITSQPADVELLPGETTTFSIQFAPVALGTSNVTLNIASKDCRENPYNFALKGQGCVDIQGTISGTQAICAGLSANLTVNISAGLAPFVVTLSDGSTFTVNNIGDNTVTVSPTATTTYTIAMITDANGCCSTNTGSAIVTVNPLPTPTITVSETSGTTHHDGILCAGASATLDAGVYAAWDWSDMTHLQTISAAATGTYTVTVTDGNGCKGTDTQVIVVNSNPTPTITETDNSGTPNDNILCAGGSATLDAGSGYSSYVWSPSGNTQTLSVSAAGTYTVVVTDANGCTGTNDQAIAVNALPAATLSGSLFVCPGTTSAILDLNITAGVAPFTVVLSDNSSHNVAALGASQLTVAVAGPATNSFTITSITGADVCSNSGSGTATVVFDSPGEIEVKGNGVAILDGDLIPSLNDYTDFGNVDLCGNRVRTFTIHNTGNLTLNISSITSSSSNFTIGGAPTSISAGNSATFTVTFSATATGVENATITINNSDCDEGVYDFGLKATVIPTFSQWTQLGGDIDGEAAGDNSGYSVSLSGDGTIMVIGARNNDGAGANAGQARVYQYNGAAWVQLGADINGEAAGDLFGYSVAISADGKRIAAGGVLNNGGAGHVRVYEYNGSAWIQLGNDMDGEAAGDESGRSVSLSADGSVVAIGAIWNDDAGNGAGQVRVYQLVSGSWVKLGGDIDGEAAGDNSGFSVSLSSDGTKVAVGAYQNDGNGANSGQARVYQYNGSAWVQLGADINGESAGDSFGAAVSLSSDGTKLAVGADQNDGAGANAGHTRVFQYNGSAWVQTGADIDGEAAGDEFGYSVSLSSDGTKLAVGGRRNDGNGSNAGHVRVFRYNGSAWTQIAADINGEAAGDETGNSVSLSADGSVVAAGAQANNGNGTEAGHARVFAVSNQPEANVQGNSTNITDGDNTPSTTDHTDFGLVAVNGNLARTFTIFNAGNTTLTITSITSSNGLFVVSGTPASVAASGSATFTVTFNPAATGVQNATITINNNDCDEAVYDFVVTGKGATPASALNFDGIDDYITTANNTTLDLSTQTVEFWAKPNSGGGDNDLLVGKRNYNAAGNNGIRWSIHFQNGNQGLYFYSPAGQAIWTYTFTPNQWYHIAMVTDATSTKLYIDGTFISSKATTINSPTNLPVIFGASGPNFEVFPGSLDEVRIWNTARTCDQINQLRNCELTGSESGLMAYYKFNQGFAGEDNTTPPVNTLTDATANANNGTLTGFTLTGPSSNWVTPGGVTTGSSCPAVTAPEANVQGNGVDIANGDATPSTADHTDFGLVAVNGNLVRMFTLFNTGNAALTVSSITSDNVKFVVSGAPTSVAAGSSASFTVTFTPTALGTQTATITINNNDCDEAVYNFAVTGKGATPAAALNFDGTDDFVSVPDAGSLDLGTSVTLEAWVKPESFAGYNMIIDKRDLADVSANYGLTLTNGKPMFYFWNGGNVSFHIATNAIALNAFTHLAATYDGAMVRIFVNGTQVYAQAETDVPPSNNQPLSIGRNQVALQYFDGDIDEVRIWNTVRNCDEIGQRFNCEMSVPQPGLVAYYKFNQGFAAEDNTTPPVNTLTDATANANNGTLNGFALSSATSNWVTPGGVTTGTSCPAVEAPEIDVQGNSMTILDGDTTPSTADDTDYGIIFPTLSRNFTIHNTGTATLTISSITVSGAGNNGTFSISGTPPSSIPAGSSATFTVLANPISLNLRTATINIFSNDCDEAIYNFNVQGGRQAAALAFDGTNDYVTLGTSSTLQPSTALTLEAWVRSSNWSTMPTSTFAGNTEGAAGYSLSTDLGTNTISATVYRNGVAGVASFSRAGMSAGFHHIAMTYDGQLTRIYLDGNLQSTNDAGANYPIDYTTNSFILGAEAGAGSTPTGGYMNGQLDEVRIWNIARLCAEIRGYRSCELPGSEPGLVAYYKFNQGMANGPNATVTTLNDATTNAINGDLQNFSLANANGTSNWTHPGGVTTGTSCTAVTYPEANVQGGLPLTTIADGDITPSTTDHTDFGLVTVNGSLARTFTIFNTGNAALTITSITSNNGVFVVSGAPTTVAANGGSATFTVTFNPTALGIQNATITVNSNDCDEAAYDFAVTGTGATPASALHFDGVNDNVSIPNHAALQLDQFTLETWFYPSTAADFPALPPALIAKGAAGSPDYFMVPMFNTRKIAAGFWNGASFVTALSTTDLAQNTWYHLAATFDGTTLKMYVNGVLENTVAAAGLHPQVTTNALSLGLTNGTQYVNGALDEVRIWNVARSCEEIRQLRNCELTGSEGGLVAYYKFNQGFANEDNSGVTTLTDAATTLGGANDGTLGGFTLSGAISNWVTPGGVVTGTSCPASITYPEADLLGHNNTPLADGTTSTSVAQGTNLGNVNLGSSSAAKTFTIQNNGTAALSVTSIASSNPQFGITPLTPASPILTGMSASFTITFTPTANGVQNAIITIHNNDCDEAMYDFAVTGTGACIPPSFSACPTGPLTANTVTSTCAAPVSYTVTEAGNPAPTVTYAFTGATTGSGTGTGSGSSFNKGSTIVTVTATSTCNPAATCTFTVTVTDNEKPQITCAGPVNINTTAGLCTGTTVLSAPTVTDNCPFGGNGLNFDGNDDQVISANYSGTALTGDLTLECWFKGSSLNGRTLFGRGFQQEFDLTLWNNQLDYYHGNGATWVDLIFSYTFSNNTWYHVAVVRNASAQTVSLYVNGVFQQTLTYGTPLPVAQTAAFRIGHRAAGQFFLGSMDEVRVWTVARTPAQIAGNWNKELAAQPGLFALYHLNEGVANGNNAGTTTAADASGNAKDGTLTNFALIGTTSNWGIGAFGGVTNNAPATFPKGNTTVTWTATDASGNTETCQQTVTVTDNEVPVLTVPAANIPLNVIATTCAANYTIASPITDNCTGATWTYTLSGATTAATSSAIASGTGSGVVSFNKGVTTVTLNGVDAANNAAVQKTFTVTVTDNEAPNVTACFGTNISAFGQATGNSFTTPANSVYQSFTAPVTGVITSIQIQLSGGASGLTLRVGNGISCGGTILGSKTFNGVGGFQTITFDTPIPVTGGVMYNFGILGNHSAGWATVGSYPGGQMYYNGCPGSPALPNSDLVFTVNMNYVPPISINVAPGTCAQTYAIPAPTLSDNCTGPLTWNATFSGNVNGNPANLTGLADGSPTGMISFSKGTTNVVLNGVDANGIVSTTTCPFTVTVVDNEKPTLSGCATDQSINVIATTCAADYAIPAPTLMDNCAGPLTWNAAFSGNTNGNPTNLTGLANGAASSSISFNKGTTTVTLTATDAANNTSTVTCSFVVTVVDNEKPQITCTGNITQNTNVGACVATVTVPSPTATDNCSPTNTTNGLNFDGSDDFVTVSSAPFTSYTIETWVKFTGTSTLSQSVIYFTNGNTANFSQEILTDNAGHFQHYLWDGSARYVTGTTVAALNTWYHVAIVATNSGFMRLYVNGVEEGTPVSIGTMQVAGDQLVFGKASIGLSYFKGTLDEVRIWNQVRSQAQIQSSMNTQLAGNDMGLYRYFRFNEGIADGNNMALTSILATTGPNGTPVNMTLNGPTSNFVSGKLGIPVAPTMTNSFNGTSNASGDYPKGTTTVIWTATDANNNTQTCQQTVTVTDNELPTLACANQSLNTAPGLCTQTYTITDPITDNCSGATWGYSATGASTLSGSGIADGVNSAVLTFNKGVTTVVLSGSDAASNAATTCSFTITVTDNQAPTISCPAAVTVCSNPYSNTYVGAGALDPIVTDNCSTLSNVTYLFSGATTGTGSGTAAGKTFNLNNTTIRYTVTDAYGAGTASCTVLLVVRKSPWPYWQPGSLSVPTGNYNLAPLVKDYRAATKQYKIYLGTPSGSPVCVLNATNGVLNAGQTCNVTHSTPGLYQYFVVAVNDYATGLDCEFTSVALPVTVTGPGQTNEGEITLANKEASRTAPVLYPNPTDGLLNVRFADGEPDGLRMMLYDTDGRLVLESSGARQPQLPSAAGATQQFDLSRLPSGVYLFRMVAGEQQYTGRVVKVE